MDREQQVLWLGMLLIAANFFFSGQFRTVWSVFATKPSGGSNKSGNVTPSIPNPLPGLPNIPLIPIKA